MAKYVPSPRDWVREQVDLYENSGGTKGTTLRDTGLPVVLVTHWGNKTGAIRKTPLMRVKDGDNYILIGSQGGAPKDPGLGTQSAHQSAYRASRRDHRTPDARA
jgi:F420H(2)-dependent quinone reductase